MSAWIWVNAEVLIAVHEAQPAEHGGSPGTRDAGLFQSALARPQNLAAHGLPDGSPPDFADLAAAYGYGISRNHPFIDGNKRTGFVAAELFLVLNGHQLVANDADCVLTMLSVAAGESPKPTSPPGCAATPGPPPEAVHASPSDTPISRAVTSSG